MANLIDTIGSQLSADTLQKLGANLGVDPAKLKPAATTAAAATLDAVAVIGATKGGAERLIKLLPSGVDDLSNLLRSSEGIQNLGKQGAATTAALFGDNCAGVVDCIASSNGISQGAASSILDYVAPVVLGKLNKEVKSQNLTASSLTGYLSGQRASIDKAIPAGYADCMRAKLGGTAAVATMVGSYALMDDPEPAARKVGDYAIPEEPPPPKPAPPPPAPPKPVPPPPPPPPEPKRSWNWLWWLLGLLVLLALLAWLFRACMPAAAPVVVPTATPVVGTPTLVLTATVAVTPTVEVATATPVAAAATVTPTAAVTVTVPVTEALELTGTLPVTGAVAGAAAGAAAAVAGAAGDAANSAVCTAIGGYDEIVAGAPTITADTPVAEVQSYVDSLRQSNTGVTTALGALEALNIDLGGLTDAFDGLTTTVDGLTGTTVGDSADSINASLTQINDAYTEIKTTAGCQ